MIKLYEKTQLKIKEYLQEGIFPGVDYAFVRQGKTENKVLGDAQKLPVVEPLQPAMLFDVASLTKVIGTTTVILKLWEQGKIDMDQPIQAYLPSFDDQRVTIRHLLTHTSNIDSFIPQRDQLNQAELREAFYHLPSGEMIGKQALYTDTGMILLGFMIEQLFDKEVQQVIEEEVLLPLNMSASSFAPTLKEMCVPTENHPTRGLIRGEVHDPKAYVLGRSCGSAGLFSNQQDILRFSQMVLDKGFVNGTSFLQANTIEQLFKDQTPSHDLKRSFGWDLRFDLKDGHPMLFHTGYTGTFLLIDLQSQEIFSFLSNRVHPVDHRDEYLEKRDEILKIYLNEKAGNDIMREINNEMEKE